MARPKIYEENRVATAVRLPESMHAELRRLARARDVSVNYLITRAVEELLTRAPGLDDEAGLFARPKSMGRSA
jgi:predicted transcriptional regulator